MTLHDEMVIKRAIYRMIRVHHEIGMFANFLIRKALLNNVCLALLDLLDNLEFEFYEYKEDNSSSRCRFYKPMPYISDTMLLYRNSMSPIHKHKPYLFIAGIKSFYK